MEFPGIKTLVSKESFNTLIEEFLKEEEFEKNVGQLTYGNKVFDYTFSRQTLNHLVYLNRNKILLYRKTGIVVKEVTYNNEKQSFINAYNQIVEEYEKDLKR